MPRLSDQPLLLRRDCFGCLSVSRRSTTGWFDTLGPGVEIGLVDPDRRYSGAGKYRCTAPDDPTTVWFNIIKFSIDAEVGQAFYIPRLGNQPPLLWHDRFGYASGLNGNFSTTDRLGSKKFRFIGATTTHAQVTEAVNARVISKDHTEGDGFDSRSVQQLFVREISSTPCR